MGSVENPLIDRLRTERLELEEELEAIERRIGELQRQCVHEADEGLDGKPTWWCKKCGGEVARAGYEF